MLLRQWFSNWDVVNSRLIEGARKGEYSNAILRIISLLSDARAVPYSQVTAAVS